MFKDYTSLAMENTQEDSVSHQAMLQSKLVRFAKSLLELVPVKNLAYSYSQVVEDVNNTFKDNCSLGIVSNQLAILSNTQPKRDRYYNTYHTRGYYAYCRLEFDTVNNEAMDLVKGELSKAISSTLLNIAMKERYIEYKLNDNEEKRDAVKLSDTVAMANLKLNRQLAGSDLFNLKYVSSEERGEPSGFVHQVQPGSLYQSGILTRPEIIVDKQWMEEVHDRNLNILEYEGSHAFTLSAKLSHLNTDRTLYDVKIVQIQGNATERLDANRERYYSNNGPATRRLFKVKDVVLSVSSDNQHRAIGNTAKRAESTMKRRQKAAMLKSLNL